MDAMVEKPESAAQALKVLVVDDTATNRQILQVFLRRMGYEVEVAVDGAQAVEQFRAVAPDLVLMDVMMPVMDGYEATRRIKALSGANWVPVVFLSALDKEENLIAGLDAGGDDYLHKPVNFVVLDAKLRSLKRTIQLQKEKQLTETLLRENAERLQRYHDAQELENSLAQRIMERQLNRAGLADPAIHHWLAAAANFSGDVIAAERSTEGKLYVLLADATGHGLAAAISVLPVLTVFYGLVEQCHPLGYVVMELNRHLLATMPMGRFVACSALCIDSRSGQAEVWQGGMPDILVLGGDGQLKHRLSSQHVSLGIVEMDEAMAATEKVACQAGDQFALFSDGLIEATNAEGLQYGQETLQAVLGGAPAARRLDAVRSSLYAHAGIVQPQDDISLLLIDAA